jgi:hypothetical protein
MAAVYVPVLGARIIIKGTDQTRPQSFSLWACKTIPAAPTYAELVSLAAAVAGVIPGNAFLADIGVPFTFTGVEAHDASTVRGPSATSVLSTAGTGATLLPTNCAPKVILSPAGSAAFRKPSQTFLPAAPSSAISGSGTSNTLAAAYITAGQTFIASIQTAIAGVSTYVLSAVSRRFNNAPRASGLIAPVSTIAIRPGIGSQVRRLHRVSRVGP